MDRLVLGPELLKEMEEIVKQVQGNLKVAQDQQKSQADLLLPQPFSPILVFHLNSGTPPHHYLLGSIVESLAPLSISLHLKLIAHPFACFVQFSLSRVVCFSTRRA